MYAYDTENGFRAAGPAATALTDYLAANKELRTAPWSFGRGTVSSNGRSRAWAEYTHPASSAGAKGEVLSAVAMETQKGSWKVDHTIT